MANSAIRSRFVDTHKGSNAPSHVSLKRFHNTTSPSLAWVPASQVPHCHRYYEKLRLPALNGRSLMDSFTASHPCSTFALFGSSKPNSRAPFSQGAYQADFGGSNAGSLRFPENPSCIFALLLDPGRPNACSPKRKQWYCPHIQHNEDVNDHMISRLDHTALIPTVYASRSLLPDPMQDSFPAGWLTFAGRESNPLDFYKRFQLFTFSFSGLTRTQAGRMRGGNSLTYSQPVRVLSRKRL